MGQSLFTFPLRVSKGLQESLLLKRRRQTLAQMRGPASSQRQENSWFHWKTFTIKVWCVEKSQILKCVCNIVSHCRQTQTGVFISVYLAPITRSINNHFRTLKVIFFQMCYSYFGGITADFPVWFSCTAVWLLNLSGREVVRSRAQSSGDEGRVRHQCAARTLFNGGDGTGGSTDDTGSSFRTCLESSQSRRDENRLALVQGRAALRTDAPVQVVLQLLRTVLWRCLVWFGGKPVLCCRLQHPFQAMRWQSAAWTEKGDVVCGSSPIPLHKINRTLGAAGDRGCRSGAVGWCPAELSPLCSTLHHAPASPDPPCLFFCEFWEAQDGRIETSRLRVSHRARSSPDTSEDPWLSHPTPGRGGLGAVWGELDAEVLNVQPSDCSSSGWAASWGRGSCCCCSQPPFCGSDTLR